METTPKLPEITYTPEEVAKSVSAAYDSVNLINELKAKETLTEDETATLARNEEHIRIMMGFEWFVAGLTDLQVTELQAI
jgi:hypothetical protein